MFASVRMASSPPNALRAARVLHAVADVRVGEDGELPAERLARGAHALDVGLRRVADAQLDRLVAGFDALARLLDQLGGRLITERDAAGIRGDRLAAPAEQPVER